MHLVVEKSPHFVREWGDEFLELWPHRFDYLFAPHPLPGDRPSWQTESRHPLSDRLLRQGSYLYGVRFGPKTRYVVLDIDKGSPYHPANDEFALSRIRGVLEELELVESITISSSHSGGLHIYFPFSELLPSWQVGLGVSSLLENSGFKVSPGLLEVFPNAKPFSSDGSINLFNGHRLPLQQGSYILSSNFEPTVGGEGEFLRLWKFAESKNGLGQAELELCIKKNARKGYRVSGKAQKFLNDLNAEIEPGWTGQGQTNRLLGRIAMRGFVFGHVLLRVAKPLVGDELIEHIVSVARNLPGFDEFCGHIQELEAKAKEWVRSVENSHYYPYGSSAIPDEKAGQEPDWNGQQSKEARERIKEALGRLLEGGRLPSGITDRFDALVEEGIGGSTLYRHKDLWHPKYLEEELRPDPEITAQGEDSEALSDGQLRPTGANKLVGLSGAGATSPAAPLSLDEEEGGSGGFSTGPKQLALEGIDFVRNIVEFLKAEKRKREEKRKRGQL
jgi:hypothetical protein